MSRVPILTIPESAYDLGGIQDSRQGNSALLAYLIKLTRGSALAVVAAYLIGYLGLKPLLETKTSRHYEFLESFRGKLRDCYLHLIGKVNYIPIVAINKGDGSGKLYADAICQTKDSYLDLKVPKSTTEEEEELDRVDRLYQHRLVLKLTQLSDTLKEALAYNTTEIPHYSVVNFSLKDFQNKTDMVFFNNNELFVKKIVEEKKKGDSEAATKRRNLAADMKNDIRSIKEKSTLKFLYRLEQYHQKPLMRPVIADSDDEVDSSDLNTLALGRGLRNRGRFGNDSSMASEQEEGQSDMALDDGDEEDGEEEDGGGRFNGGRRSRATHGGNGTSEMEDLEDELIGDNEELGDDDEEDEVDDEEDEDEEDEEDEEEDEEAEEEEEDEDEIPSISDDEDMYKLEDPDDIDEEEELRDEEEEEEVQKKPAPPKTPTTRIKMGSRKDGVVSLARETRKRQLSLYDDDEDEEEESSDALPGGGAGAGAGSRHHHHHHHHHQHHKRRMQPKRGSGIPPAELQPQDIDEDLILTDEEAEYNPRANPDWSKMTERQRARFAEESNDSKGLLELDDTIHLKKTRPRKVQSEQQIALRKAESARRRHDYKLKQLEEEKQDTVNKLLKRRATKTRANVDKEGSVDAVTLTLKQRRPTINHPALFRWVSSTSSLNGNSLLTYPALDSASQV